MSELVAASDVSITYSDLLELNDRLQQELMDTRSAVAARDEVIETQREDIANLERELRGKRAALRRARAEQNNALRNDPFFDQAIHVLEHWRALCYPNARELGGRRLENCLARLKIGKPKPYTVAELKKSVYGYSLKPYVVNGRRSHEGTQDQWHADAELIFRSAEKVDQGIRIAERAEDLRKVLNEGGIVDESTPPVSEGTGLSALGEAALRFARRGWMVFPCRPRDKAPATPNGLLDAKRDAAAIFLAWGRHPDLNIGVCCGAESGIVVLDVDGDEGMDSLRELETRHGELPRTASVRTPRGGQHFYFAHPGVEIRNTAGFPAPGLDVRGDGGYVLAPPSVGPGGRAYEPDEQAAIAPMPKWLVGLLTSAQKRSGRRTDPGVWEHMVKRGVSAGQRNTQLTRLAGYLVNHLPDAGVVEGIVKNTNRERCKPPLSDREVERLVASVLRMDARSAA